MPRCVSGEVVYVRGSEEFTGEHSRPASVSERVSREVCHAVLVLVRCIELVGGGGGGAGKTVVLTDWT